MDSEEVSRWAKELQAAVRPYTRLSRSAAEREVCMFIMVSQGIRCAGLLSAVATNDDTVKAVRIVLRRMDRTGSVFVLVHTTSEQTFIVHRELLIERLRNPSRRFAFYDVDCESASQSVQRHPPAYLVHMLDALSDTTQHDPASADHDVVLLGVPGEPLTGIALAGWLLEYALIYFYALKGALMPRACRWNGEGLWPMIDECGQDVGKVRENNLAHQRLSIVSVDLQTKGESRSDPIIQFSVPSRLLPDLAQALGVRRSPTSAVEEYLKANFENRLKKTDTHMAIRWHEQTLERVAM